MTSKQFGGPQFNLHRDVQRARATAIGDVSHMPVGAVARRREQFALIPCQFFPGGLEVHNREFTPNGYRLQEQRTIFYDRPVIGLCANAGMSEDKLIRLDNLRLVMKAKRLKGPTALGRAIERTPSYTGPLIDGKKNFGERIARHIEDKLGLPRGWLDDVHDEGPIPFGPPRTSGSGGDLRKTTVLIKADDGVYEDQQAAKAVDQIIEETRRDNAVEFSPMATRIAKAFDQLKDVDLQIEAFATCISEITKLSEGKR